MPFYQTASRGIVSRSNAFTLKRCHVLGLALSISISISISSLTSAAPSAISADQVETWLGTHEGRIQYQLKTKTGGLGQSWIEVSRTREGEIDVWEGLQGSMIEGKPSDLYTVTHKRYSGQPPFSLLSAEMYELFQGQARAGAWRSERGGEWVSSQSAKALPSHERRDEREGASVALDLWGRDGIKSTPLPCEEDFGSRIGLGYASAPLEQKFTSLIWAGVSQYTLKKLDRRLVEVGGRWQPITEVNVVDQSGQKSSTLIDDQGRDLAVIIADQLTLVAQSLSAPEPLSFALLETVKGKVNQGGLREAIRPIQDRANQCIKASPTAALPQIRLNIDERGRLVAVRFVDRRTWGPLENCLAPLFTSLAYPRPTGGAALVEFLLGNLGKP